MSTKALGSPASCWPTRIRLYDDANGIDDAFERQKRGALLPATAALADRQQLAADWKAAQRKTRPPAT